MDVAGSGGQRLPTPSFLGIPGELRMLIYEPLVGQQTFWINFPRTSDDEVSSGIGGSLKILRVSKQIHDEAQKVLRVCTLHIDHFSERDFHRVVQVPGLISRWTSTIETVFLSYRLFEGSSDGLPQQPLLHCLQDMIASLPRLSAITFDEKYMEARLNHTEVEERTKAHASRLRLLLASFNHTTSMTFRHEAVLHLPGCGIKTRFEKSPMATSGTEAARNDSKDGRRRVLLESVSRRSRRQEGSSAAYESIDQWVVVGRTVHGRNLCSAPSLDDPDSITEPDHPRCRNTA